MSEVKRKYNKFTRESRENLARLWNEFKLSGAAIMREMQISRTALNGEIARGFTGEYVNGREVYDPQIAELMRKANNRKRSAKIVQTKSLNRKEQ